MLVKCPECGNDVSDKAKTCPHCGYTLLEDISEDEVKTNETSNETSANQDTNSSNENLGGDIIKGLIGASIVSSLFRPRRRRRPPFPGPEPFDGPGPRGPRGPRGGRGRRF